MLVRTEKKWIDMGKTGSYTPSKEAELGINFLGKVKMRYFKLLPESNYSYYGPQINELEPIK